MGPIRVFFKLELTLDLLFQCFGILKVLEDTNVYVLYTLLHKLIVYNSIL